VLAGSSRAIAKKFSATAMTAMQTVADLDLSYLPIEEDSFARDPFTHFAAAPKE
jgi:hypothetical protein